MSDNPVTKTEALQWFDTEVRDAFAAEYDRLLRSGGVEPEDAANGYAFAKIVLRRIPDRFPVTGPRARGMMENLDHF